MTSPSPPAQAAASAADRITTAERALRDRVNDPRFRSRLPKEPAARNQIASSLDAIGDTTQALMAYLVRYPTKTETGVQYLFAYGALQALFIQQDATIHLSEALGGKDRKAILKDERLDTAREIRNRAVGHPTRKDRPRPITTHQISQISLGPAGFDMLTASEDGSVQFETVDLVALIQDQAEAVAETLEGLISKLDHEDTEVRRRFRAEQLQAIFPPTLDYTFGKLSEATREHRVLGLPTLAMVKDVMHSFAAALERRGLGIDSYPGIKAWYAEIQHPFDELERFFSPAGPGTLHPRTAAILVHYLWDSFKELKEMAAGIDEAWRLDESDS